MGASPVHWESLSPIYWQLYLVSTTSTIHLTDTELIHIEKDSSLETNISLFMWDRYETFLGMQINIIVVQARHTEPTSFDVTGPNLAIDKAENESITVYPRTCNLNQITFMSYTRLD